MEKTVKPIRSEADYQKALELLDELLALNPEACSETDDQLEVLTTLIHAYEQVHHPIAEPDPVEALKYIMKEKDWKN